MSDFGQLPSFFAEQVSKTVAEKDIPSFQAALNQDYNRFANVLGQRELAKLEKAGIDYRLPVPGAGIDNGYLAMNVQFPSVSLQYSLDGQQWFDFDASNPPQVSGEVALRSRSASGMRFSRVTVINE